MRVIVIGALLLASPFARAQIDICKAERADANLNPPVAEDVQAYQRCLAKWRDLAAAANGEMRKPQPAKLAGCEVAFNDWKVAAATEPADYDAMVQRLLARVAVDKCNADVLTHRLPASVLAARRAHADALRDRGQARSLIALGSVFLSLGGAGLSAIGATGIVFDTRGQLDNPVGIAVLSGAAGAAAALAVTGAILLSVGAHRYARTRRVLRF